MLQTTSVAGPDVAAEGGLQPAETLGALLRLLARHLPEKRGRAGPRKQKEIQLLVRLDKAKKVPLRVIESTVVAMHLRRDGRHPLAEAEASATARWRSNVAQRCKETPSIILGPAFHQRRARVLLFAVATETETPSASPV